MSEELPAEPWTKAGRDLVDWIDTNSANRPRLRRAVVAIEAEAYERGTADAVRVLHEVAELNPQKAEKNEGPGGEGGHW